MARLRVRVELNRGGVGIPLHKLASVVQEAQRFFQMLAHDVHIEKDRGEWLAFDLDNGSLNFTAEYVGPVSAPQVDAFYAAFDGVTSLRPATIAQFTRIAEAISEDELIGFGLYQSDQESEPSEWRCLSRRDALRISDEIRILQGAAGGPEPETHLRAIIDSDRGARLFKERHNRTAPASDQSKWAGFVRAIESNLANRISRLEGEVENHSGQIRDLRQASAVTEESFRNLLTSVEKFCGQATNQLEKLAPQPALLSAPASFSAPPPPPVSGRRRRMLGIITVVLLAIAVAIVLLWPSKPSETEDRATASNGTGGAGSAPVESSVPKDSNDSAVPSVEPGKPAAAEKAPVPVEPAKPRNTVRDVSPAVQPPEPGGEVMHIELEAREAAWVSVTDADGNSILARTLEPHETRSLELSKAATLRTGNAGALVIRFNGKEVGPLGPEGKVRDVEFKDGTFKVRPPAPGQGAGIAGEGKEGRDGEVTN